MPTVSCNNTPKIIPQTLFLGASVSSFNCSNGWGTQPSQLTVNLVEDIGGSVLTDTENNDFCPAVGNQFFPILNGYGGRNHYDTCDPASGCYVIYSGGANGAAYPYIEGTHDPELRMWPGKVYYTYNLLSNPVYQSEYWIKTDPGFFGQRTRMNSSGTEETGTARYKYDIVDTPVFFKMGGFEFFGLVQSWSRNLSSSGKSYTVIINSMQSLLNSSYIILDRFAGAIFSKKNAASTTYGSPKNFIKSTANYIGDIAHGNIPNVFNVYGFLESMGLDNFGVVKRTDAGVSVNKIIDALLVLTSSVEAGYSRLDAPGQVPQNDFAFKYAFSPYGRIIAKSMQIDAIEGTDAVGARYDQVTTDFNKFGAMPPKTNPYMPESKCEFVLDLSELPPLPNDFRISEPVISIMQLLTLIGDQTGHDIYLQTIPATYNLTAYNVIKVKTISRLAQPLPNDIENTIKKLQCHNYEISSSTIGKEKNENNGRALIIGGQQQRLYQAKSYRLAYTQSSFVYNCRTGNFINYMQLGSVDKNNALLNQSTKQFHHGKTRFPNFLSTRNPEITNQISLPMVPSGVLADEDQLADAFTTIDSDISDSLQTSVGTTSTVSTARAKGNYLVTVTDKQEDLDTAALSPTSYANKRWFPLHLDTICPFFGYVSDQELSVKIQSDGTNQSGDFRNIRPVWLDSWTGQIAVIIRLAELPVLHVPLVGLYSMSSATCPSGGGCYNEYGKVTPPTISYFVLTESEIRAALAGFDNFLVYQLAKLYKPDLIEMVRRAYKKKIKADLISQGTSPEEAEKISDNRTNWYWRLSASNIANDDTKPGTVAPDRGDGSSYISEEAIKDLQLLHKFVSQVGSSYGKKYMVTAKNVKSYRDESVNCSVQTSAGYAYVFSGNANIRYNYTPTNDGAWEEYGNFIDDTIVVGDTKWYNLTDEAGKIKPLLGYNANDYFDYMRYNACQMAQSRIDDFKKDRLNPYWNWDSYLFLQELKNIACQTEDYIFPSLDFSSLGTDSYILTKVYGTFSFNSASPVTLFTGLDGLSSLNKVEVPSYDAWGSGIMGSSRSTSEQTAIAKKKLYIPTTVEEKFVYLDSQNLLGPKILIDSPGVFLSHSSSKYVQDPNRTIVANTSIEDVIIYMRTTIPDERDYDWIRFMLSYCLPISRVDGATDEYLDTYGSSAGQSNLSVEISPKAAHPFFAAIPIRSNQFSYGPWTNYPALESSNDLFPSGNLITCDNGTLIDNSVVITPTMATNAINNWITPIDIEVKDDFVPWTFGSMASLDNVAYKEIQTKVNYQSVLETAQLEMAGLPLFKLNDIFSYENGTSPGANTIGTGTNIVYKDTKYNAPLALAVNTFTGNNTMPSAPTISTQTLSYMPLMVVNGYPTTRGPIITNIQTAIGQNGITTSYSFRTYTRKIGLFNKEDNDRVKRNFTFNFKKNKQLADLSLQIKNSNFLQREAIDAQRLEETANYNKNSFKSKLYSWSPTTVLIGQSQPYIQEPVRSPKVVEDFTLYSNPGDLGTVAATAKSWTQTIGDDPSQMARVHTLGHSEESINQLEYTARHVTSVGLYERKEVTAQLKNQYGMQSAMSLDGLLSPISFFPTLKNSTFAYSLHETPSCPFCKGTKIRTIKYSQYYNTGETASPPYKTGDISTYCDKCTTINNKLNAKLATKSQATKHYEVIPPYVITKDTDFNTLLLLDTSLSLSKNKPYYSKLAAINLVSLNPIVVSRGEFAGCNAQNYSGADPDGSHTDITNKSEGWNKTTGGRPFQDNLRHCIEIVGRGSIPPEEYKYKLETSKNITAYRDHPSASPALPKCDLDYYSHDVMLHYSRHKVDPNETRPAIPELNQRFFGLRGPLVVHGWGYDTEGYPVPNSADEPYAVNQYGQPQRFAIKTIQLGKVKYKDLQVGELFKQVGKEINHTKFINDMGYNSADNTPIFYADIARTIVMTPDELVDKIKIIDDYGAVAGYDPEINKGSIVSKTQTYTADNRWTEKHKTNKFYLNWAERPDLWPVGPIDLKWDATRNVWMAKDDIQIYKFVYVTLEEDLIKESDFDDTYPTRAFIDDLEYSKEPLPNDFRRLVYVKDKAGYTAPRGTKLLCRYDADSGFYEPISKPVIIAKGIVVANATTTANIEMHYIQGRKAGDVIVNTMSFDNPLGFTVSGGKVGMFTYINGRWTLTSTK